MSADDNKGSINTSANLEGQPPSITDLEAEAYKRKIWTCFSQPPGIPQAPESPAALAKILAEHGRWVRSAVDPKVALTGARAVLRGASLRGVHLAGADLRGADLKQADFSGANLQGCNLAMADLSHANFTGALLNGCNLSGALTDGTNFSAADMSGITRDE